jgi:hypothetical protein
VIAELRETYPELRVYTFDYDLNIAPIQTMKKIYKIEDGKNFPILVIEDKAYYGLKKVEEIKALLPDTLKEATSTQDITSTTTISTSTKTKK